MWEYLYVNRIIFLCHIYGKHAGALGRANMVAGPDSCLKSLFSGQKYVDWAPICDLYMNTFVFGAK